MSRARSRTPFPILLFLCFATALAVGQQQSPAKTPATQPSPPDVGDEHSTNVVGCLEGNAHTHFTIADEYGNTYTLVGVPPELAGYAGDQVIVTGAKDASTKPWPSLHVVSYRQAMRAVPPRLDASFLNPEDWHAESNKAYGVKFSYPEFVTPGDDAQGHIPTHFTDSSKAVDVALLQIFQDVYAGTNFVGGWYRISVDPQIASAESCNKFAEADAKDISSRTVNGIHYAIFTTGGAAAGTYSKSYYLHTFQNGMCYEIAFDFDEYDTHAREMGCQIASLSKTDEWNLMKPLLGAVSFVRPSSETKR